MHIPEVSIRIPELDKMTSIPLSLVSQERENIGKGKTPLVLHIGGTIPTVNAL